MRRFSAQFLASVSATANTATNAIGVVTGTKNTCQIYEVIVGMDAAVQDAQLLAQLFAVSALTAGSTLTPQPLDTTIATAAATGVSSSPTAVTTSGLALMSIAFNSRATLRWAAVDPDARIVLPAGGGAAGSAVWQNQQPGTVASLSIMHQLFFAE